MKTGPLSFALLALLLSVGKAAEPLDAASLLRTFSDRLNAEPASEDVGLVAQELARVRADRLPEVRVRQSSAWSFGESFGATAGSSPGGTPVGGGALGVGAAVTVPVLDPEAAAQELLLWERLVLAEHNDLAERQRRIYEFRRSLRLLAHVDEVAAVLERHQRELLALRPRWRALQGAGASTPPDGQYLGYLEVAQALERARRERALLVELVSGNVGIGVDRLAGSMVGRPPLPGTEAIESLDECTVAFGEARRAQLVRQAASSSAAADASRGKTRASLDVSADLHYRPAAASALAWQADLRLALRVALPAGGPTTGAVTLDVSPTGVGQALTLTWPAKPGPLPATQSSDAREDAEYERSLSEARLTVLRAVAARDDAEGRVELRRLTLQSELSEVGEAEQPGRLNSVARARLAVLNAELDLDLAVLNLAETCGLDAQARISTTSRLSAAIRSTSSARSAWSSSILPSSLRTKRV
ncbi:MAG: hypothetical protein WD314_16380 [Trueperaceae bacterium]